MLLTLNRFTSDDDATLSTLSIDGQFECFVLEDEYREQKVASETRIPAGIYCVGVRDVGGFHNRYSSRFNEFHKGMLQLLNVPGFEYILIHVGNTDEDTAGCLLVGAGCDSDRELVITKSVNAYKRLYKKVINAALDKELAIEIVDNDHGN